MICREGKRLIKEAEGFRPEIYLCPAGRSTVGYGHVVKSNERFDLPLSEGEADRLLDDDLTTILYGVRRLVVVPLSPCREAALVSFVYNVGFAAFERSTLLRRLNRGKMEEAADQFDRWVHATVKGVKLVLPGLVARRVKEKAMFLAG